MGSLNLNLGAPRFSGYLQNRRSCGLLFLFGAPVVRRRFNTQNDILKGFLTRWAPSLRVINRALTPKSKVITPSYPFINPFIKVITVITPFISGRGPPRRAMFRMQVFLSPLLDGYFENSSVQTTPTLYQQNSNIISSLSLATHVLLHQLF